MTQLTLELTDELLGLDFPDFSVVMEDEPEWRRESALLSFFLRPCRDFNLLEMVEFQSTKWFQVHICK